MLDPAGWHPFGPAKQGAVLMAACVAVALAAKLPGRRLPRAVTWCWGALLAWLALAAAVGDDRLYAWVGTPERRLGWVTWALLAGCAWAGARLAPGLRWWCRTAVVGGLGCGMYCLTELWWRAPVEVAGATSRLGGPFGSAAYLGAAMCLMVPLAIGVAAAGDEPRAWRAAAAVAAWTCSVALVGSGTRAAWVACAAVAVLVLVARRPSARLVAVAAGLAALAVVAVAPRLGDVAGREGAGGSSRVAEWEVAMRVIASQPVLGAGPEGYRIAFADGVDADYEREYGRDALPDRAHSGPLDVAAIGGVPAALAHAALLALVARRAWRVVRTGDARWVGVASAVLAYLVQQLALFPLAELDPAWWLLAGALLAEPVLAPSVRPHRAASGAVLLAAVAVFVVSVVGVAADRSARTALRHPPGSAAALAAARRSARLRPDEVRYHLLVAATALDAGSVTGAREAVAATERAADVSPGDPVVRQARAQARTSLARITGQPGELAAALGDWEALVGDDPFCGPCWYGLGVTRLVAADAEGAQAAFDRADELGQVVP